MTIRQDLPQYAPPRWTVVNFSSDHNPLTPTVAIWVQFILIKDSVTCVPDRVKSPFVIFDSFIWQQWASKG